MKTLRIFSVFTALLLTANFSFAQEESKESFKVSGVCGMCKTRIEKAARAAGATFAEWNIDKKELTVKYASTSTNAAKIKESIANAGHDTPGFKASDKAYNNLHECCKYDRDSAKKCCDNEKCGKGEDCCAGAECCKDKECCSGDAAKMGCCKDGKCTKEGHDGKNCCKS